MSVFTPPHPFQAVEIKVYPTERPEQAKTFPAPEQTGKLDAIRREALKRWPPRDWEFE